MGTEDFTDYLLYMYETMPEFLSALAVPFFTNLARNSYGRGDYLCCLFSLTLDTSFIYVLYRGLLKGELPKRLGIKLEIGTAQK